MGATASLSLDQVVVPAAKPKQFGQRVAENFEQFDWVPDLGLDIGSARWFRGLATCLALCGSALLLAPGFAAIPSNGEGPLSPENWEERRALAIAPLAQGGDSGKRMAATDAVVTLAGTPERPSIDLTATLGQGDGFGRVLERAGVSRSDAARVADLVVRHVPLGQIEPGTAFRLTLGRRSNARMARPLDLLQFRARFDLALDIRRANGVLVAIPQPLAIDHSPLRIQGRVGDSLYRSARAAGAPPKVVEAFIRALGTKLSLGSDVNSDARFDIIAEQQRAETGEVRFGRLLFAGLDRGGRRTQLLEWTIAGQTEWFEASGVGQRRVGMTQPVYGRKTSGFGMRHHPVLHYARFHKGVDFGAAWGSPIYAVSDGVVSFAGRSGGYGNQVRLTHGGSLATSYSHMSRIAVPAGSRVNQGQVIGWVGSTGLSTGPHLHFEVYKNGQVVNPSAVRFAASSLLEGRDLESFRTRLKGLLATPVSSGRGSVLR